MIKQKSSLFQRETIPIDNIYSYIRDFVQNGDYFIPVCGDVDSALENKSSFHEDSYIPNEFIQQYDERLVRVYRHQGTEIVLKNTRKLNGPDPSKMGLKGRAIEESYEIDKKLSTISKVKENIVVTILQKGYDILFKDKSTGFIPRMNIWVPMWSIDNSSAVVFHLFDRINIIIT